MTAPMDLIESPEPTRRGRGVGLLAIGIVIGMLATGLGVAAAQGGADRQAVAPASATAAKLKHSKAVRDRGGRLHALGHAALHGEFTTRAPGGGYRRMAVQRGDVTAVSATSLTVKSADGFTRTYVIDRETVVRAGSAGAADLKAGNAVYVVSVLSGSTARAVRVIDATRMRARMQRWKSRRDGATTRAPASRV